MATLYHQVWINAPAGRVYRAIAQVENLVKWWTFHTHAETAEGHFISHNPGPEHGEVKMKILERTPESRVVWEVVSEHPKTSPASAWTGTKIVFDISSRENPGKRLGISSGVRNITCVEFRHEGWDEKSEYFGFCNFAWGAVLLGLQQWCERP